MPRKPKREPIHTIDDDGKPIVLVPVTTPSGEPESAKVLPEDFATLSAQGLATGWFVNYASADHSYVRITRAKLKRTVETVARLIVDARPQDIVRYIDGNHLNLRGDNLNLYRRTLIEAVKAMESDGLVGEG